MSGKLMRKLKSTPRRHAKLLKTKARRLSAVPDPGSAPAFVSDPVPPRAPVTNTELGLPSSFDDVCQVCFNKGMFCGARKEGDPALWYYCLCSRGTEQVAAMIERLLKLDINEKDRITATRYLFEPGWPEGD